MPPRYRTTNWSTYNASLRMRGSLLVWFDRDMAWFAEKAGKLGRPEVFSDAAIQFCLSVKVLFGLPLRQTSGMVASLLEMADLDWPVPDFSTLCRRQRTLKVQIPYRRVDGPLNLLVDSTGIKFLGDGEWQVRKHGTSRRQSMAQGSSGHGHHYIRHPSGGVQPQPRRRQPRLARPAGIDPRGRTDRHRDRRWRIRHPQMSLCHHCPRRQSDHTGSPERTVVEGGRSCCQGP